MFANLRLIGWPSAEFRHAGTGWKAKSALRCSRDSHVGCHEPGSLRFDSDYFVLRRLVLSNWPPCPVTTMMDINAIDSTHTIIAGAVLLVATLYFLVFSGKRRSSNAPPFANVGIPLLGNYIEFAKNPIAFQHMCRKSVGDVFTVAMLHKKLTFLLSPEASKCFYKEKDDAMSQSEVYGFMTAVFGKDVVYDAEPKKRIQQMQHMATNLQSRRLAAYVPKIPSGRGASV